MLAGLALFEMPSHYPWSAFQGFCGGDQRGSAAVCDPNPPRPFARYREKRLIRIHFETCYERAIFGRTPKGAYGNTAF